MNTDLLSSEAIKEQVTSLAESIYETSDSKIKASDTKESSKAIDDNYYVTTSGIIYTKNPGYLKIVYIDDFKSYIDQYVVASYPYVNDSVVYLTIYNTAIISYGVDEQENRIPSVLIFNKSDIIELYKIFVLGSIIANNNKLSGCCDLTFETPINYIELYKYKQKSQSMGSYGQQVKIILDS